MKNLNEYINEGLFDNIGIGPERQIEEYLNSFEYTKVEDLSTLKKFKSSNSSIGAYFLQTDKHNNIITNIKTLSARIFPNGIFSTNSTRIEIPDFININKLYLDTWGLEGCSFQNINSKNWSDFFPKKMIPGNLCALIGFENCNINDKELKQITEQFTSFRGMRISNCENIKQSEIKLYPVHSLHKQAQSYLNKIQITYNNDKNLSSISFDAPQVQNLYLDIINCDNFKSLKGSKFSAKNFQLDFQSSKLGDDLAQLLFNDEDEKFLNHPFIKEFIGLIKNCNKTGLYINTPEEIPLTKNIIKKFDKYNFDTTLYHYGL